MSPAPSELSQSLHAFIRALRQNGLRVTQHESLDAMRALTELEHDAFATQEVFRAALKTTLVKRAAEEPLFDRIFDLHFDVQLRAGSAAEVLGPELWRALVERGLDEEEAREAAEAWLAQADGQPGGGMAGSLLEGDVEAVMDQLRSALARTDTERLTNNLQIGYFTQRLLHQLGLDELQAQMMRAQERLGGAEGLGQPGRGVVEQRLLALRRLARSQMQIELEKRAATSAQVAFEQSLAERPFRALTLEDEERVVRLIRRMCERLKTRVHRRVRSKRVGRLDVRRTLRTSLATEGVPIAPRFVRQRKNRPQIVLLCDVSDSVRAASGFMLHFVYAVADLFTRVRSFVFVSRTGEVTDLFAEHEAGEAIRRVMAGEAVSVFANSDYGASLRDFAAEHLESITSRTTVIVLGDGRTNYAEPEAWILEEIRRRAHRLWWLCPEAQATWGFGDSRMGAYARACDRVFVVRSVADLAQVVDHLLFRAAIG